MLLILQWDIRKKLYIINFYMILNHNRFFLMHLINKPDTEYTGQETYVWNMYQQRCWDFFPVGDCFRKQNETVEEEAKKK